MFAIQYLDHDEGSCARWNEFRPPCHFETREQARAYLKAIRAKEMGEWCLYSYRIAEVGSELYYSQPTDALEY